MHRLLLLLLVPALLACVLAAPAQAARKMLVVIEGKGVPSDAKLLAALDKSGFKYDLHEIAVSGVPQAAKLFEYTEGVLLRTQASEKSRIGLPEAHLLSEFLLTQGRMFLFGTAFSPDLAASDLPGLLLCQENGTAAASSFAGIKYDLVSHGMDLAVAPGDHAALLPVDKGEPVLQISGDRYAAVKGQTCSYRLLVTAFQPGELLRQADLDAFVKKSLEWFFGNQMGIGVSAPDASIVTLDGAEDGLYMHLPGNDKVILLEFFATWCDVCAQQKPILEEIAKRYAGRVEIVAISYKEDAATVKKFLAEHPEIRWKVLLDVSGQASKKYAVRLLPTLFVIDRDKRVQSIATYTPLPDLANAIEAALRGSDEAEKSRAVVK